MIYFTSDTHFGHKNICRGTSNWSGENSKNTRNFKTLEEMNESLVKRINERVKENDELYHLGDWSFGGIDNIWNFRKQLSCKRIHLIFGNHDEHIVKNKLLLNVEYPELYWSDLQMLKGNVWAQDLFESVQFVKTIHINSKQLFLSHYSHQVWDKSHKGAIHLFGHSHGTLEGIGRSMDVGVDTSSLYPYSITEILGRMEKIQIEFLDHHTEKTTQ